MVFVVNSAQKLSSHLKYLSRKFPDVQAIQVHLDGDLDVKTEEGIRIAPAVNFLSEFV